MLTLSPTLESLEMIFLNIQNVLDDHWTEDHMQLVIIYLILSFRPNYYMYINM